MEHSADTSKIFAEGLISMLLDFIEEYDHWPEDIDRDVFRLLEPMFAESAWLSVRYANDILKGRFPDGEAAILESPFEKIKYLRDLARNLPTTTEGDDG